MNRRINRRGFTLYELILAIFMIGVALLLLLLCSGVIFRLFMGF